MSISRRSTKSSRICKRSGATRASVIPSSYLPVWREPIGLSGDGGGHNFTMPWGQRDGHSARNVPCLAQAKYEAMAAAVLPHVLGSVSAIDRVRVRGTANVSGRSQRTRAAGSQLGTETQP